MRGILNRVVVRRAEKEGLLERLCRGIDRYPAAAQDDGLLLYYAWHPSGPW